MDAILQNDKFLIGSEIILRNLLFLGPTICIVSETESIISDKKTSKI